MGETGRAINGIDLEHMACKLFLIYEVLPGGARAHSHRPKLSFKQCHPIKQYYCTRLQGVAKGILQEFKSRVDNGTWISPQPALASTVVQFDNDRLEIQPKRSIGRRELPLHNGQLTRDKKSSSDTSVFLGNPLLPVTATSHLRRSARIPCTAGGSRTHHQGVLTMAIQETDNIVLCLCMRFGAITEEHMSR